MIRENFFYDYENKIKKLNETFYQRIVEMENDLQRDKFEIDEDFIEELATLYKVLQ
jgi:hypothetical protein